jgi:hypothetical protein
VTIRGTGTDEAITVEPSALPAVMLARLTVEADDTVLSISIDTNHLYALETACRAARLEIEARAVG